jgi:hypothetical protein
MSFDILLTKPLVFRLSSFLFSPTKKALNRPYFPVQDLAIASSSNEMVFLGASERSEAQKEPTMWALLYSSFSPKHQPRILGSKIKLDSQSQAFIR